jgi:hypothetical protein
MRETGVVLLQGDARLLLSHTRGTSVPGYQAALPLL